MVWARLTELAVGIIVLLAAASKAARMQPFVRALETYRLVRKSWATWLARATVVGEGVLGALLVSQRLPVLALASAACAFATFAAVGWLESRDASDGPARADCGCLGGVVRLRVGRVTVAVNAVVATACLVAAGAYASTGPATAQAQLDSVAPAAVWPAALSLAALYWLTVYAVSVVALMDDATQPRSSDER